VKEKQDLESFVDKNILNPAEKLALENESKAIDGKLTE